MIILWITGIISRQKKGLIINMFDRKKDWIKRKQQNQNHIKEFSKKMCFFKKAVSIYKPKKGFHLHICAATGHDQLFQCNNSECSSNENPMCKECFAKS